MKKQFLIALTIAFVFSVLMWGSRFNYQIKLLKSQVLELQRLADEPRVLDLTQDTWKQDHESDLSTFLSVMMAKEIKVGHRKVGVITPQQRLDLCRWLLDFQAKQRFEIRKTADPNSAWYPDSYMAAAISIEEDVAQQSGLVFLKPYDPRYYHPLDPQAYTCPECYPGATGNLCPGHRSSEMADDSNYFLTSSDALSVDPNTATAKEITLQSVDNDEVADLKKRLAALEEWREERQ